MVNKMRSIMRDGAISLARGFGFELHRYVPVRSSAAQLNLMLAYHAVDVVIDVGANKGQFALELRRHVGYRGRIVSFEPLQDAYDTLCGVARGDLKWEIAERVAIGAAAGVVEMNVSGNSVSSSLLEMHETHSRVAPNSKYASSESVRMETLDFMSSPYLTSKSKVFVKVDTQGYESEVLKGAGRVLQQAVGIQLEMSLVPLYIGQQLMPDLAAHIEGMGFKLWGITPALVDGTSGKLLQVDATYFRERASVGA
jgi:FkbM family methyltransferase